ncbi:MFS transporter [Candidatus Pelagibacter sp.]|nr:MFS transporter [Candidatus Pelagibacter sp.]
MFKSLNFKVILFGFIFTFFSSFGQSFFLGLFNPSIREALSITHGQFGSIYASATLLSSFILIWVGKKIDDMNILKFSSLVILFFAISSFMFSKITSITFLFISIFLMRLSGQGLMSLTATSTVSRFFEKTRGRALSISWLGLSLAEFILPLLVVFFLSITNWRNVWLIISLLIIFILPVVSILLVKDIKLDSRETKNEKKFNKVKIKHWTRIEVLKDYRFYIICANLLAMPWIFTGFAVFQSYISLSKNWGPYIIAQSFMAYSFLSVLTLFTSGFLIDKFTSRKLLIYMNIPLLFSVIILFYFKNEFSSFFILAFMGISNGFANVLGSSTWAELYGVKHIGSIKALTTGLMVFSTALGTALFGILIDNSFSIEQIALVSSSYILIAISLLFLIKNKLNPNYL